CAESRVITVRGPRNVQRIGLRAERHRTPVLESGPARTHFELNTDLWDLPVGDFATVRPHLHDVLVAEIGGVDERAGGAVELPEDAQLTHLEERLAAAGVNEDALEHLVHVLCFARKVLVIPLYYPRVGIQGRGRVGVSRVIVGSAGCSG